MPTLDRIRRPGRHLAGLRREVLCARALGIAGRIDVELLDERGRIVRRESGDNYVNVQQWEEHAEALQKLSWMYGYQGDSSTVTVNPYTARDPRMTPTLRNDHVACWTDTTAEDATDMFPIGETVAWAHRWQQGSPATRQGLVQPSLCTLTRDSVSFVWEWTTANGNGTFQSVGFRRLGWSATTGDQILHDVQHMSRRLVSSTGFTDTGSINASTSVSLTVGPSSGVYYMGAYYNSADGNIWRGVIASGSLGKLVRCPVTFDANGDYTLGSVVDESANAIADGLAGNNVAITTRSQAGICRLGASGDWISVGWTGSGSSKRPYIRRVTTAGTITYTNANAGTYTTESVFSDVTYDGTNLWVTAGRGNDGTPFVHRIDPATGTISATISAIGGVPTAFPIWTTGASSRWPLRLEWDAGRSCLWLVDSGGYIYNMDTSGTWGGVLLYPGGNNTATLSGQHASTQANARGLANTDDVDVSYGMSGVAATAAYSLSGIPADVGVPWGQSHIAQGFLTMDGNLWSIEQFASFTTGTPSGIAKWAADAWDERPSFASRTLLASPITKTSTQTMRLRYTITFS